MSTKVNWFKRVFNVVAIGGIVTFIVLSTVYGDVVGIAFALIIAGVMALVNLDVTGGYFKRKKAPTRILMLKKLLDEGIITQEEYLTKSEPLKKYL